MIVSWTDHAMFSFLLSTFTFYHLPKIFCIPISLRLPPQLIPNLLVNGNELCIYIVVRAIFFHITPFYLATSCVIRY